MQVGPLRSEDGKSDCGLPTFLHHGPNFPHKPRLGPVRGQEIITFSTKSLHFSCLPPNLEPSE